MIHKNSTFPAAGCIYNISELLVVLSVCSGMECGFDPLLAIQQ
jgi:hypothetical protein